MGPSRRLRSGAGRIAQRRVSVSERSKAVYSALRQFRPSDAVSLAEPHSLLIARQQDRQAAGGHRPAAAHKRLHPTQTSKWCADGKSMRCGRPGSARHRRSAYPSRRGSTKRSNCARQNHHRATSTARLGAVALSKLCSLAGRPRRLACAGLKDGALGYGELALAHR